jgi:ABC-type uncharacterized transport system ATPase subunit
MTLHAPAVELRGINKRFGAVHANKDIDLSIQVGTVAGIIGENGAGKSTLVSILYGFYTADEGEIRIGGDPVEIQSTADAISHGVGMVHQHFMLVPTMTVLENVMLGREGGFGLAAGEAATRARLAELGASYGLDIDPDALVADLPVGLQQRVEILKALLRGARLLILDEPTGVLTPREADRLFEILRMLKADGVTILLITHKLREIMEVTDTVAVMRHGEMVAHRETAETSREELARLMVGRDVLFSAKYHRPEIGDIALRVDDISLCDGRGAPLLEHITFDLRAGEILGIAGVAGNGQSELLDVLSGITAPDEGAARIGDTVIDSEHAVDPATLRDIGVAHIPEDRHRRGMVLSFSAAETSILGYHRGPEAGAGRLLDPAAIRARCAELMAHYDVRPPDPSLRSGGFSGGNQQKLVVAREIAAAPRVLLVGQPTRGVDIGAIEFIHKQLIAIRDAGCAILLVSVELEEIMALSDRILVMNDGRIVGEATHDEADVDRIGMMMAGIDPSAERSTGDAA